MSQAVITVQQPEDRIRAARWCSQAPAGTRVVFKAPKRTIPQNDKLWATLTDIACQVEWYGQKLTASDWKDVFTASLRKSRVVPGIEQGSFVVLGLHTSSLTKAEFSDLLEIIHAFGAERGVVFHDQEKAA